MLAHLRHLRQYAPLIRLWLRYRVQLRYAQTTLGILWNVLLPLLSALVYAFALGEILGAKRLVDAPYVPFLLSGQLLYAVFSSIILNGRGALLAAGSIATQVYFPREIILLLVAGEALVDFGFALGAMVIVNALYGIPPMLTLLLLIFPLVLLLLLSLGISFFLSWASLLLSDLQPLITVAVQLLFFLTPIFYEPDMVPESFRLLILLNPLAHIIDYGRAVALYGQIPPWQDWMLPTLMAGTIFILGYHFFKRHEDQLMDCL